MGLLSNYAHSIFGNAGGLFGPPPPPQPGLFTPPPPASVDLGLGMNHPFLDQTSIGHPILDQVASAGSPIAGQPMGAHPILDQTPMGYGDALGPTPSVMPSGQDQTGGFLHKILSGSADLAANPVQMPPPPDMSHPDQASMQAGMQAGQGGQGQPMPGYQPMGLQILSGWNR